MDQPGKVANPARGQLGKENENILSLSPFTPDNLVSRDGFGSPVPRKPAHLRTQAESGIMCMVITLLLVSIHTFSVLSFQLKKLHVTQQVSL